MKTTGGAGLLLQVPIAHRHSHEDARRFAETVAWALERTAPKLVTTERRLARVG